MTNRISFGRTIAAVAIGLCVAVAGYADSSGEHAPSATSGSGFDSAINAYACDGTVAQISGNNRSQDFSNFGFAIPANALVTGVQVHLRANDGAKNNRKVQASLSWNGGSSFTAALQTRNFRRNQPLKDYFLGGSAYLWNRSWNSSELSDANFRVRLVGKMPGGGDPINIDCLGITVYFHIPGAPNLNLGTTDGPDPVEPGQNLTYSISYSNTGESTATGVVISDSVPSGTTFVSATPPPSSAPAVGSSGSVFWPIGALPPGGSGTVVLVVKVNTGLTSGTELVNASVAVASDQNGSTAGNPETTTVLNPVVLSLSKSDSPDPVKPGATLTYVLTYSNSGTAASSNVLVSELYDANVAFVSAVPAPDPGFTDQWTIPSIAPGAQGTITITTTAAAGLTDGVLLTNSADISDDTGNSSEASSITTVQNVSALSISQSDDPDPAGSGGLLTYMITYTNSGTTLLNAVRVVESYDANVSYVSAVPPPDSGTQDTWSIGALAPGASGSITITAVVAAGLANGTLLHGSAYVADGAAHAASTSSDTLVLAVCGNGSTETPEQCDDGALNGSAASCCSAACTAKDAGLACADDGNLCTDDQCDGGGTCIHVDNAVACDDGELCTSGDFCSGGTCHSGSVLPCDDANPCTSDRCAPGIGCEYTILDDGVACNSGAPCATSESCQQTVCTCAEPVIDPFKCYTAKVPKGAAKFRAPADVSLSTPFYVGLMSVKKPVSFCNPVDQNGVGVSDATAHLECYRIVPAKTTPRQPKFAARTVKTANQFGGETLKLGRPKLLCVPAENNDVYSALQLDHFECYSAKVAPKTPKFVAPPDAQLVDTFESKRTRIVRPNTLCLPVDKNGAGILNPDAQLECYRIADTKTTPRQARFAGVTANSVNEFGGEQLSVRRATTLCVPSTYTLAP